ncbi:hypothetical protein DMI66_12090 [Escherichia coli]|nr:hypothetical protein [Escherichia coli]
MMYLFLQNMRATLIPTIAVPVVLLGTFAILAAFGYSICHTRRFWLLHQYANDVWDGTCHRTSC